MHFHDVEKDVNPEKVADFMESYLDHLKEIFPIMINRVETFEIAGK